jgi:hypothetical protein
LYYSTHLAYDPEQNLIFITEQNHNYRSLVQIDANTKKKKTLIKFSRTGELVFNKKDRSIWGVKHQNGFSIIVKIPEPYTVIIPMYSAEFGKSLFDLAISNNGEQLSATLSGVSGFQSVVLFQLQDLENGIKQYKTILELEDNTLNQFKFSLNDQYLIGTSYYTGVSNIWRISLSNNNFELLSNTETGFFMPLQHCPDSLIVLKFQRDGMQPGTIPIHVLEDANSIEYLGNLVYERNPEIKELTLSAPPKIMTDSLKFQEGSYNMFKEMKLINAYPDIAGFKNTMALGYRLNFSDYIGISNIKIFLGTSPWSSNSNKQKIHAQLDWKYWNWNLKAAYNKTDFYDLFGPTKRSRAGYMIGLNYNRVFALKKPLVYTFNAGAYTYGDLEVLPQYQSIVTPIKDFQALTASFEVKKLRKTLGGIQHEKGFTWEISAQSLLAKNKLYPELISNQNVGFLMPGVRNTSFWIRNSIGQSFGDRTSPLSHFYFGGFRNNYVDWQPSEQYRKPLAFPGVAIDEIKAHNYVKTMGELNLKPIRLRDVGTSWFYPTYIKTALFGTHLITNYDLSNMTRNIYNLGCQVDVELVLFSYLKTTWSAGYAMKFEKGLANSDQFMLSLKLLGN